MDSKMLRTMRMLIPAEVSPALCLLRSSVTICIGCRPAFSARVTGIISMASANALAQKLSMRRGSEGRLRNQVAAVICIENQLILRSLHRQKGEKGGTWPDHAEFWPTWQYPGPAQSREHRHQRSRNDSSPDCGPHTERRAENVLPRPGSERVKEEDEEEPSLQ